MDNRQSFIKLFYKWSNDETEIVGIPYDCSGNYYKFIEDCYEKGLYQYTLFSSRMIKLLDYYYCDRRFDISEIMFLEDNEEFSEAVNKLRVSANSNRNASDGLAYDNLVTKLNFLLETEAMDIRSLNLINRENRSRVEITVNGMVEVLSNNEAEELQSLIAAIEA